MKHIFLLSGLLFLVNCSKGSADYAAIQSDCDSVLNHVVTGKAGTNGSEYHISISVDGTPMLAIADTGSSNLLINPMSGFTPSNPTNTQFSISYGDPVSSTAFLTGYQGKVDLHCASGVKSYNYGYITNYSSTNGTSAATLMGLAYRDLQQPAANDATPTFFKDLVNNDNISNEFAMLLCGVGNSNSQINFGGISNLYKGTFHSVPILVGPSGVNDYYNIGAGAITVGETSVGSLESVQTILDSGTTLNLIPPTLYQALVAQIPGTSNINPGSVVSCPDLTGLPNVTIMVTDTAGNQFPVVVTPQTYFKNLGGGQCFFGFAPGGNIAILGQVTMENYYVHFDRKNHQIGFAPNTLCNN
ncbi:MAG: pepsin-like aspartyl protease [Myxococcaceae bacterium]